MDIKGIARNILPLQSVRKKEEAKTKAGIDADNNREGNGQSSDGEREKRRPLTPEELQDAVQYLESLAGVKDNRLTVRVEAKGETTNVYIEDRDGKVVRRIPESELRSLTANRTRKSGHLLNKAM